MTHPVLRQIMPATDWHAFYLLPEEPYYVVKRLVAWVLGERPARDPEVLGLVVSDNGRTVEDANSLPGFHMYLHQDALSDGTTRQIIAEHKANLAAGASQDRTAE